MGALCGRGDETIQPDTDYQIKRSLASTPKDVLKLIDLPKRNERDEYELMEELGSGAIGVVKKVRKIDS